MQPWLSPFPVLHQSIVLCPVLTVSSWPSYRFIKRQVKWSGMPISKNFPVLIVIHAVKGFSVVNKAEVDVFLKFSCLFCDPVDVGNLISGSSALSKSSLKIWMFLIYILLKPGLKNFEHYLGSMLNGHNFMVVWTSLALLSFRIGVKTDLFQSCGHCWVFLICWHIECSTFTASSFRTEIAQLEFHHVHLALFVVMLPKAQLTAHSRCLALGEWPHHRGYPGHLDVFCTLLLCILAISS